MLTIGPGLCDRMTEKTRMCIRVAENHMKMRTLTECCSVIDISEPVRSAVENMSQSPYTIETRYQRTDFMGLKTHKPLMKRFL